MWKTLLAIVLLLLLIALVFSIPAVQTKSAHELTHYLNHKFNTDIHINKITITYGAQIDLKGVFIADHHNDTLINAKSLKTSLINFTGLFHHQINFGNVTGKNVTFRLRRYKNDSIDSFGIFLNKLESDHPGGKPMQLKFKHINLIDSKFSFVDEHNRYPDIISLKHMNIDVSDFTIKGGAISAKINKMKAYEHRGLDIQNFSADFQLSENNMDITNIHLKTPQSTLKSDFHFSFKHSMADFENRVHILANFKEASLSTTDLSHYYDELAPGNRLNFHGIMKGTLNDYTLENFAVDGPGKTHLFGDMTFKNMLADDEFRFDGDFQRLQTNYKDLAGFMPDLLKPHLPEILKNLGSVDLSGQVAVTKRMVKTNATLQSSLGEGHIKARLNHLKSPGNQTYDGTFQFQNFDLGALLGNPKVGKASFTFKTKGKGFRRKDLNSNLDGTFTKLVYNGYTYHNIRVKGVLKNPVFYGKIVAKDPNLKMHFDGKANVAAKTNDYNFEAHVDYADLHALNFVKKDTTAIFKGRVVLHMKGHNLNDVTGDLELKDASYKNRKGTYKFKKLSLSSTFEGKNRSITINSPDIINGYLKGHFVLTEVPDLIKNSIGKLYANYQPVSIQKHQWLSFKISIHNKIVQALFPAISVEPETIVEGKIKADHSGVQMAFTSPEITVAGNKFKQVDLKLNNANPLFATYLDIDSVTTKFYDLSQFRLITNRLNDTLYVRTQFKGGENNQDEFHLNFYHTINKANKSVLGIRRSNLRFKGKTWFLNKDRKDQALVFDNNFKNLRLDTLVMSYKDESIALSGVKHGKGYKDFDLSFVNVDLSKISPSIKDFALRGIINGKLELDEKKGVYYPSSDLTIRNFAMNDIDYGNLNLNIKGNKSLTSYTINARLADSQITYLAAKGKINVGNNPKIDVDLHLNQFKLAVLNALGHDVISNIRGTASGYAHVGGDYRLPSIDGELEMENVGMKLPYLNIDLAFENHAKVKLSKQEFHLDHVAFEDTKYHTKGWVSGSLTHHNFRDWRMNLNFHAPKRLLVLDTKYTPESLYYGTAFISGQANIQGPFDALSISVNATSQKGTIFKIPLSDAQSVGGKDYIYFLTRKDKEARKEGKDVFFKRLQGLELNFNLHVTRDAEVEIVVDKRSGSTLKGRGEGRMLMEINTAGKFNMWGNFTVKEGTYDFKYAGLINKQFEVVPGGTVAWDGSPTRANLNVEALYKTHANPASILENPTINRSIPVDVYIVLKGLLTDVDISFDIKYPNLSSVVKSELQYRINSRGNNEIQALSLITQGSFYSENTPGGNAHPENLLYERAASLFDDLFSKPGDKFRVGVDYTKGNRTPEQDIADRVGVTVSTQISNRILINGRVGVPIGGFTQSVVVGDVEVDLLLNEEGTLRAKIFNRESDIQYIGEELGYTQGVGISYSVDFDTFKELIRKILNKKISVSDLPKQIEKDKKESLVPDYIDF